MSRSADDPRRLFLEKFESSFGDIDFEVNYLLEWRCLTMNRYRMHLIKSYFLSTMNCLLHVIHVFVMVFVIFGWVLPELRYLHGLLVLSIIFCWFGLGLIKGIGYCPVTDLQWVIRKKLGLPISDSYIKFCLDKLFRTECNSALINNGTWIVFIFICFISGWFYWAT
jgi:hypothetical protein